MAKDRPGASESISEFAGGERSVLSFPLGDPASAGVEPETVGGGVCNPGADGRALLGRGVRKEVVRNGHYGAGHDRDRNRLARR